MSTDAFDDILKRAQQLTAGDKQRLIDELSDHTNGSKPSNLDSTLGPPLTQLGAKLREIRTRIVQSGELLLDRPSLDTEGKLEALERLLLANGTFQPYFVWLRRRGILPAWISRR